MDTELETLVSRVAEKVGETKLIELLQSMEEQVNGQRKKDLPRIIRDMIVASVDSIDGG